MCLQKLDQIEEVVADINQFDTELTKASEESDIELLRKFQDRRQMATQVQDSQAIKELLSLSVATHGLIPLTGKKEKEEPPTPFLSL